MLVGDIAVGKDALVNVQILDQLGQIGLGIDGNALGVELARQLGRIAPALNVWNLGRRKGHDLVRVVVPEKGIIVVKIPARCTNDDHPAL